MAKAVLICGKLFNGPGDASRAHRSPARLQLDPGTRILASGLGTRRAATWRR